jgi:exodeoxyribonuclease VII small subunit
MLPAMDEGKASPAASAPDISGMSFEEALGALEQIVQQLERGEVPLDQSIGLYERGEALRAACQQRLDAAQARIEKIVTGADGRAAGTRPFDAEG